MIKLCQQTNHSMEIEILRSKMHEAVERYGMNSRQALRASMALDVPVTKEQGRRFWNYEQAKNVPRQVQDAEYGEGQPYRHSYLLHVESLPLLRERVGAI